MNVIKIFQENWEDMIEINWKISFKSKVDELYQMIFTNKIIEEIINKTDK